MNEDTLEKIYQERLEEHRISSLAEKIHAGLYGVQYHLPEDKNIPVQV